MYKLHGQNSIGSIGRPEQFDSVGLQPKKASNKLINKIQIHKLIMSSRNSGSLYSRNRRRDPASKYSDSRNGSESEGEQIDYKRIRVIQKNLVYAIGLTESIATNTILQSDSYFGKYGKVVKTIINKNANTQAKNQRYTAYVTFQSEFEASLAILALDDYSISERPLKVSYGTTKYCSYFLKKYQCPNIKDCYFLHKWDIDNELTVDDNSKQVFNKQLKTAMRIVADNLPEALRQHKLNLSKNLSQSLFPEIDYAVHALFDNDLITQEQFQAFKEVPQNSPPNSPKRSSSLQQKNGGQDSVSTSGSPLKQDLISESISKSVPQLPNDDFCLDKMIHQYISKQIMRQSRLSQSRFEFAARSPTLQDGQKIKKFIEVYIAPKKN